MTGTILSNAFIVTLILLSPLLILMRARRTYDTAMRALDMSVNVDQVVSAKVQNLMNPELHIAAPYSATHVNVSRLSLCVFVEAAMEDGLLGLSREDGLWWHRDALGRIHTHKHLMDALNGLWSGLPSHSPEEDKLHLHMLGYKVVELGGEEWTLERDR